MKIFFRIFLIGVLTAALFVSCFMNTEKTGTLVINLPGTAAAANAARTVLPDVFINSLVYQINCVGPGIITQTANPGDSIVIPLSVGKWTITVTTLHDEVDIGSETKEAIIEAGKLTHIGFNIGIIEPVFIWAYENGHYSINPINLNRYFPDDLRDISTYIFSITGNLDTEITSGVWFNLLHYPQDYPEVISDFYIENGIKKGRLNLEIQFDTLFMDNIEDIFFTFGFDEELYEDIEEGTIFATITDFDIKVDNLGENLVILRMDHFPEADFYAMSSRVYLARYEIDQLNNDSLYRITLSGKKNFDIEYVVAHLHSSYWFPFGTTVDDGVFFEQDADNNFLLTILMDTFSEIPYDSRSFLWLQFNVKDNLALLHIPNGTVMEYITNFEMSIEEIQLP